MRKARDIEAALKPINKSVEEKVPEPRVEISLNSTSRSKTRVAWSMVALKSPALETGTCNLSTL